MSSPPPVSLGKPSLRHRLESYYSLVAPDAIADKEEWKRKFEIIYQKFGGTVEGETKLSIKLAKKYGDRVRLLVAPPHPSMQKNQRQRLNNQYNNSDSKHQKREESHYEIDDIRKGSRVLDFASHKFDALYALQVPETMVTSANATLFSNLGQQNSKLDNISKFRPLLPECDPQRLDPASMSGRHKNNTNNANTTIASSTQAKETDESKTKKLPMFLAMASKYQNSNSGPLSLLYNILENRQRVRVMIRYVDCIRGTLTGYLVAFDKHFNIIMRDVDEVYSGRVTRNAEAVLVAGGGEGEQQSATTLKGSIATIISKDEDKNVGTVNIDSLVSHPQKIMHALSKAKLEAQRRRCYPPDGSGGPGPTVKQRYFHQLLVRGDNVVMIWRADAERSIHPRTNKSPASSIYSAGTGAGIPSNGNPSKRKESQVVGTPGSLYYALQRWENQNDRKRSHSQRHR